MTNLKDYMRDVYFKGYEQAIKDIRDKKPISQEVIDEILDEYIDYIVERLIGKELS